MCTGHSRRQALNGSAKLNPLSQHHGMLLGAEFLTRGRGERLFVCSELGAVVKHLTSPSPRSKPRNVSRADNAIKNRAETLTGKPAFPR